MSRSTIEALMRANLLEVFGERDPGRRRAAIARVHAADVRFADHDGVVTGHDALDAKAGAILDRAPGLVFAQDGPVEVVGDLGHLPWTFGPPQGPPVVRGTDIVLVADERIARLYVVLTQAPPRG